ncbi:MAG: hypothetical protein Q9212_005894 [Teloschistes hypoglaucus]
MASSQPLNGGLRRFARLIPGSKAAQEAFDSLCDSPEVTEYHRSFLQVERVQKDVEVSSDSEESSKPPPQQTEFWSGYYSLSLNYASQKVGLASWRVGKGTTKHKEEDRGVDLLLIGPGNQKHKVTDVHAMIRFHPVSGVLMLVGMHDSKHNNKKSIRYEDPTGNGEIELGYNKQHVLFLRRNAFWIGDLYYIFEFEDLDDDQYRVYRTYRDGLYRAAQLQVPHPALSAIPRASDKKFGPFIRMGTMSKGAFGWVYAGVDADSGKPLAIKEHSAKTRNESQDVVAEANIGKTFSDTIGLLPTIHAFCEHRELQLSFNDVCRKSAHKIYTSSPLAIGDFNTLFRGSQIKPSKLIEFYRGPLLGLEALHFAGYMHRDVSRGNLLVTSRVPPEAVLHDFGKAIKAPQDHRTDLGAMVTLAPEVDGRTKYSNKIDIWSLAFSFCQIAFPRLLDGVDPTRRTTRSWLDKTLKYLENFRDSNPPEDAAPVDLIIQMLAPDPDLRISASRALRHACFATKSESPEQLLHHKAPTSQRAMPRSDQPNESHAPPPSSPARAAGPIYRQEAHGSTVDRQPSKAHYGPGSAVKQDVHDLPRILPPHSARNLHSTSLTERRHPSPRYHSPTNNSFPWSAPRQISPDAVQKYRAAPQGPSKLSQVPQQAHHTGLSGDHPPPQRLSQPSQSSSEDSAPWITEAERRKRALAAGADQSLYRVPKHQR